jgi:chitinase
VLFAIGIVVGTVALSVYGWREWRIDPAILSNKPWFAPYVDVTATPQFDFEQLGSGTYKDAILSFIVASHDDGCQPTWGGEYTPKEASDTLDLDRRIARLKQQGGTVAVSFGGLRNDELATTCQDQTKLLKAYGSVVDYYKLTTIDLDLENEALTDPIVNARRAQAIAALQHERRKEGKSFAVWATIPTSSQGLTKDGTDAIAALLKYSVDLSGINIMTMDYGEEAVKGKNMSDVAIDAIKKTERQIGVLYSQSGTYLNDATLWRKIGTTPMIGQTDVTSEVFTVADAKRLNTFSRASGVGRMSMWSANRDVECGANYVNASVVSESCSGVKQDRFAFVLALGTGFDGTIAGSAVNVTVAQKKPSAADIADNPASSPYQIWSKTGVYLQGTKVVWHHNVYQAKWWTKGDAPDNPVLQAYETPWELIGPVLPGEKPTVLQTLPAGTYPEWSGDDAYEANQRVLFQNIPYQAKWWNRGESPAAASSNPDASPWVPLTQAEIDEILKSS